MTPTDEETLDFSDPMEAAFAYTELRMEHETLKSELQHLRRAYDDHMVTIAANEIQLTRLRRIEEAAGRMDAAIDVAFNCLTTSEAETALSNAQHAYRVAREEHQ